MILWDVEVNPVGMDTQVLIDTRAPIAAGLTRNLANSVHLLVMVFLPEDDHHISNGIGILCSISWSKNTTAALLMTPGAPFINMDK